MESVTLTEDQKYAKLLAHTISESGRIQGILINIEKKLQECKKNSQITDILPLLSEAEHKISELFNQTIKNTETVYKRIERHSWRSGEMLYEDMQTIKKHEEPMRYLNLVDKQFNEIREKVFQKITDFKTVDTTEGTRKRKFSIIDPFIYLVRAVKGTPTPRVQCDKVLEELRQIKYDTTYTLKPICDEYAQYTKNKSTEEIVKHRNSIRVAYIKQFVKLSNQRRAMKELGVNQELIGDEMWRDCHWSYSQARKLLAETIVIADRKDSEIWDIHQLYHIEYNLI